MIKKELKKNNEVKIDLKNTLIIIQCLSLKSVLLFGLHFIFFHKNSFTMHNFGVS